jgi:hypothetical protein
MLVDEQALFDFGLDLSSVPYNLPAIECQICRWACLGKDELAKQQSGNGF